MDFAISHAKSKNYDFMQIEVISPVEYNHEFKTFLLKWYQNMGFKIISKILTSEHSFFKEFNVKFPGFMKCECEVVDMILDLRN